MKIESLSNRTLKESISLVVKTFNSKPSDIDYPGKWMPASISKKKNKKFFAGTECTYVKYWVGIDEESKKSDWMKHNFSKDTVFLVKKL